MGYGEASNGYKILNPSTGKVIISRSVIFDEGFVTADKFIVVSDIVQSQPVSSTNVENEHTENDDKQIEISIKQSVSDTEAVTETPLNDEAEPEPVRRSTRHNKGIPARRYCMSYMARTELSSEPESWAEM